MDRPRRDFLLMIASVVVITGMSVWKGQSSGQLSGSWLLGSAIVGTILFALVLAAWLEHRRGSRTDR